ncbi:hypothetical protein PGTUg99_025225 [Puccinia graminis f. sp. tritici]|nr:hypothetical protein PGTUg99_025225 [Puccinia graminis f. sp. tritici]
MIAESVTKSKSLADRIDYQLKAKKRSRTKVRGSLQPTDLLQTGNPTPHPATPTPQSQPICRPRAPPHLPSPPAKATLSPTKTPQRTTSSTSPPPPQLRPVPQPPNLRPYQSSLLTSLDLVSSPPAHSSPSISLSSCPTRS